METTRRGKARKNQNQKKNEKAEFEQKWRRERK